MQATLPDSDDAIIGKRIAVIIYNYPLAVSSSIINSIAILSRNNKVHIFTSPPDRNTPPVDAWLSALISFCKRKRSFILFRACRFFGRLIDLFPETRRLANISWAASNLDVLWFSKWISRKHNEERFDLFIPVEAYSLIALSLANITDAQIIYYNMELLDWPPESRNGQNGRNSRLKQLEYQALAKVDHVMITSPNRARIFSSINHYPEEFISVIPTAPLQHARENHSTYFRDKFSIPEDKRIVIYSGNFQPWSQCIEIIGSMSLWPDNVVLVLHTWNSNSLNTKYFRDMVKAAAGSPVCFSSDFIRYADLVAALSSADIGLLFYESIDTNFTEILFSSNKMGEYLGANLPLICSPHPSLSEFVETNKIGFCCDFNQIGRSIQLILGQLEDYRERVKHCRESHFDFTSYFAKACQEFMGRSRLHDKRSDSGVRCCICGNTMAKAFSSRLLNKYSVAYQRCNECGFLQTEGAEWLEEAYADAIAATDTGLVSRNINLSTKLAPLLFFHFERGVAYLDIGGGYGMLTRLMRDSGFDYYWDDQYCQNLMARGFGVDQSSGTFAALTAFEVIEHTPNPLEFIQSNLKKYNCRTIIFTTVLYRGENAPPKDWWYYSFNTGQHISFFQKKTFTILAKKLGLNFYSTNGIHILTDQYFSPFSSALLGNRIFSAAFSGIASIALGSRTESDHRLLNHRISKLN